MWLKFESLRVRFILLVAGIAAGFCFLAQAEDSPKHEVIKRVPALEMYPCSDCHESASDYNETKRELVEEHDTITGIHPNKRKNNANYWCQYCHQSGSYNKLKLPSGDNVSFNESYKVCLECHGNYTDEFETGIHGRKTGRWDGVPLLHTCTKCHDAHSPKFKAIKPEPPPNLPRTVSGKATQNPHGKR